MSLAIERTRSSPNHNARKCEISLLVLHYTGMDSAEAAVERLCDPEAGVSAHYVVCEDGRILQLVDEDQRAWHAGLGVWAGERDVNSASIGVEIVNGGHCYGLPDFARAQITAVIALGEAIMARHALHPSAVIGHSDLAPERKLDPGERFPWARLSDYGVGVWPDPVSAGRSLRFAPGHGAASELKAVQDHLARIGYGVDVDGVYSPTTRAVVAAFQRRFRPAHVDGLVDAETAALIEAVRDLTRRDRMG
jgi:N-acetylmuramoyl-L-alanine amidase